MARQVFVSLDNDTDSHYKGLLQTWRANPQFTFVFNDIASGDISPDNVGGVKATLSKKIRDAAYMLLIIGKHANDLDEKSDLIGYRNWINFMIARSKCAGTRLVAIKLDHEYNSPEEMCGTDASWATTFTEDAILKALDHV